MSEESFILTNSPLLRLLLPLLGSAIGLGIAANKKLVQQLPKALVLVFSGAFLLSITLVELLPELYAGNPSNAGYWILLGVLLQIVLEYYSRGAEHGHIHHSNQQHFPYMLWGSLCIHAFIEGAPLTEYPHLALGMMIHKIPIAMVLFLLINDLKISRWKRWGGLGLFALMSPVGGLLFYYTPALQAINAPILGVVIGVLLHIATTIIFESSEGHRFDKMKLASILLAIALAIVL